MNNVKTKAKNSNLAPIEHNWTPVRRGAIYCAPACGGNCTWAEYLDGKRKAAKLVQQLHKARIVKDVCAIHPNCDWHKEYADIFFKPYVRENLGWHWGAESHHLSKKITDPLIDVSQVAQGGQWCALFNHEWSAFATTPAEAVQAVIAQAVAEKKRIEEILKAL